jgi:ATP-dependent Lon protease
MNDFAEIKPIPVVPLRGGSVFPGITTTVSIGRRSSLAAVQGALERGGELLIVVQRNAEEESPGMEDVFPIGILATARDMLRTPVGIQMLVELHRRVRVTGIERMDPFLIGRYAELEEKDAIDDALKIETIAYLEKYIELVGEQNQQVIATTRAAETAGALADFVAGLLKLPFETEADLLVDLDGLSRLVKVLEFLRQEVRIADVRSKIQQEARDGAEKAQRDFMLREQLKANRKELGDDGETGPDDLREKIEKAGMPPKVLERALSELKRLEYRASNRPRPASSAPIWSGWSNCRGVTKRKTTSTSPMCARCLTRIITAWKMSRSESSNMSPCANWPVRR